ncbi:MAG: 6-pyruvoyl-tetrahydropterin synthase-related protein [Anaerolineae bacterium]
MERGERRWGNNLIWLGAGTALITAAAGMYAPLLFPAGQALYPWASDTLGHVLKVQYLQEQIAGGTLYPDLMPQWYMGLQVFRYHAPLPYYILWGLTQLAGDAVYAANLFIVLCALLGGLSWLLYRRWMGWAPAIAGGILYVFLPDNVRVALAEGNLPRVLSAALLPLWVYLLLRSAEAPRRPWHRLVLALYTALIVLSHAMMAAIYAIGGALLVVWLWLFGKTQMRAAALSLFSIVLGILAAGWWFFPSLTGGITDINASAMTEALAVFPITTYLNPLLRLRDPEIVYPGATLLLLAVVLSLPRAGRHNRWGLALVLTGLLTIFISTPGFNALYNALPLHHLAWPLRFVGFGSFALLLGLAWQAASWQKRRWIVPALVFLLLCADGALSARLIHLRPARPDVLAAAEAMRAVPGWREATLDSSRLGSQASYFFTADAGREQVYGWAYQGAHTARSAAALNEAFEQGFTAYLVDRLDLYGVDDVVVLRGAGADPALPAALEKAGYTRMYEGRELVLYHRDGAPRAVRLTHQALGIGSGAQNLCYIFPQVLPGTSGYVDDYSFEELRAYHTVVLSGFQWRDRRRAEELVQRLAEAGVRVVVGLTNSLPESLSREPYFLGVWGELVILDHQPVEAAGEWGSYRFRPFSAAYSLWQAQTPQGLDSTTLAHPYLGGTSAVVGYKQAGQGRVWFVGLNLPYHAVLTRDPAAIEVLSRVLDMTPAERQPYQTVPLEHYEAASWGYHFDYRLDEGSWLLFPAAFHDGTEVRIDGKPANARSYDRLIAFEAPAGRHTVTIRIRPTPIYTLGAIASISALMALGGLVWWEQRPARPAEEASHAA